MRILVFTLLASLGGAASGAAQGGPNAPAPAAASQESPLAAGLLTEPRVMTQAIDFASRWIEGGGSSPKDGFYPDFGGIVTGAGWISGGPGYRRHFLNRKVLVDGSAELSWRAYKRAQARLELPTLAGDRVTLGAQARWHDLTQVNYFGIGADSLETARSEYRSKSTDVTGYGELRANRWLALGGRFGWLQQPTLTSPTGPFDRNYPDARQVFPDDPGMAEPSSYLHGELSLTADNRDTPSHPTAGGVYHVAVGTYSARDFDQFSFRRYEAEALQLVPIVGKTWVLAVHGWGVVADTDSGQSVPFYMLPSLGGGNTLRAYHDYRFHDRNLLVANLESRWALFSHVDVGAFVDAGNVASRAVDLNLDKRSYGAGLRLHSGKATLGRLDVAHGDEGWRVSFKLSDVFRLARQSERTTVIPFVP
jgi:outer membrane protein assembly factor BamA